MLNEGASQPTRIQLTIATMKGASKAEPATTAMAMATRLGGCSDAFNSKTGQKNAPASKLAA